MPQHQGSDGLMHQSGKSSDGRGHQGLRAGDLPQSMLEQQILRLVDEGITDISTGADDLPELITFADGMTLKFTDLERLIPCFTPATMIATPKGEVRADQLKVGDRVLTRDNGIQTLRWVGQKRLDHLQLKMLNDLRPITIRAGALGDNTPERDLTVSPTHRVLVVSEVARVYFDAAEHLVAARDLLQLDGVEVATTPYVTYVHFMCDRHEIVMSDGAWSESFQPGDFSIKGLDQAQRDELFTLFPELSTKEGVKKNRAARPTLQRNEASLIFKS